MPPHRSGPSRLDAALYAPGVNLSAYLTSVARTIVPAAWGTLITWAVTVGILPPELAAQAESFGLVLVAVVISLYYALVRLAESQTWWPAWLSAVLLGAPTVPVYRAQDDAAPGPRSADRGGQGW